MARIARPVVPGVAHHVTSRRPARARVLRRGRPDDHALCRDPKERYVSELAYCATQPLSKVGSCASVALDLRPQCGANRLFMSASLIGAVNTVVSRGGRWAGENTDGRGFVEALREVADPAPRAP